ADTGSAKIKKCALGIKFPYEMLDNFIGSWCAMTIPHSSEEELAPCMDAPYGARYLKTALDHPHYSGNVTHLIEDIDQDLKLRGKNLSQRINFQRRVQALKLLLDNTGDRGMQIPANIWDASRVHRAPPQHWSDQQAKVLEAVRKGVAVDDANVNVHSRTLLVTGKPGAGKTEAVCGAAMEAASKGERVLIACPLGALVDVYRQRLPPNENIVIETAHASHRITRRADQQYIPPGRLRTFDLIIYDEVSQLEQSVWEQVRTAIVELNPHPFICFVGDFQQLQPARGEPELKNTLEAMAQAGRLRHIELEQHAFARRNDQTLLDFLDEIRVHQPSKGFVKGFFGLRRLAVDKNCRKDADIAQAVLDSKRLEETTGKKFTFLTVTNKGARKINHTRCLMDFADTEQVVHWELYVQPSDPEYGGQVVAIPGMRIRLTRNVDKERGFVNGAVAEIEYVLRKNVFVAKTPTGVRILAHPASYDNSGSFMPYTYGYAMTIRRSQGSTMEMVGLWFDHCFPADRGYAYVGSSRVRKAEDLYLVGKVKRSDWLPVGEDSRGQEQDRREADSQTTQSDSDFGSEDQGSTSESEPDEDQGASGSSDESSGEEDQGDSSGATDLGEEEDQGASDASGE
ncbi:unnamed protein product, partial [Polarella glacialis]